MSGGHLVLKNNHWAPSKTCMLPRLKIALNWTYPSTSTWHKSWHKLARRKNRLNKRHQPLDLCQLQGVCSINFRLGICSKCQANSPADISKHIPRYLWAYPGIPRRIRSIVEVIQTNNYSTVKAWRIPDNSWWWTAQALCNMKEEYTRNGGGAFYQRIKSVLSVKHRSESKFRPPPASLCSFAHAQVRIGLLLTNVSWNK